MVPSLGLAGTGALPSGLDGNCSVLRSRSNWRWSIDLEELLKRRDSSSSGLTSSIVWCHGEVGRGTAPGERKQQGKRL